MKRPGAGGPPTIDPNEKAKIDEEYMSLMAELGVRSYFDYEQSLNLT